MIQSNIFICGNGVLGHPVTQLFHLNDTVDRGEPSAKSLKNKFLVIADGRMNSPDQISDWCSQVPENIPFLVLCATQEQKLAMCKHVGSIPNFSSVAVMTQTQRDEDGNRASFVNTLGYSLAASQSESYEGPSDEALELNQTIEQQASSDCPCTDFADLANAFVTPQAANDFYTLVLEAMKRTKEGITAFASMTIMPPSGMKFTMTLQNLTTAFTYNAGGVSNGAGAITHAYTVWAFLSQTSSSNSQYLIIEANSSLSAGSLYANDSCDRGTGNSKYESSLRPTASSFTYVDHGPSSGSGSFPYSINVPISYSDPLGGYNIWTFSDSITSSASDWNCGSITSGTSLGSKWYMTSPCDGDDVSSTWKDAFNFWGHVSSLTAAGSGTLQVATYSAWQTPSLVSGTTSVGVTDSWTGTRFYGSSCSPGMYWYLNAPSSGFSWAPGFSVDFSTLQPT